MESDAVTKALSVNTQKNQQMAPTSRAPPKYDRWGIGGKDTNLRFTIAGASGTGKTHFTIDYLIRCPKDAVIWVGPQHSLDQPSLQRLKKFYKGFFHAIPVEQTAKDIPREEMEKIIDYYFKNKCYIAVVLDDLQPILAKSKYFDCLAISGRHRNVSLWCLTQAVFYGSRVHRLQSQVFVMFDFSQKDEARQLFSRLCTTKENMQRLLAAYKEITSRDKHDCLILDLFSKSTPQLPLRCRDTKLDCLIEEFWDII